MTIARDREYYTVAEAAEELDVSRSTVWRWIAAKRLPAQRVGDRKIRINKQDLANIVRPARADETGTRASPSGYVFVPPSPEELARRREVVQRIMMNREGRSIAPLTSVDLIGQVREEREERYREWTGLSEPSEPSS